MEYVASSESKLTACRSEKWEAGQINHCEHEFIILSTTERVLDTICLLVDGLLAVVTRLVMHTYTQGERVLQKDENGVMGQRPSLFEQAKLCLANGKMTLLPKGGGGACLGHRIIAL